MNDNKQIYIFSQLNEEALTLAHSVPSPAVIQFTGLDGSSVQNHPLSLTCEKLGYTLITKNIIRHLSESDNSLPKKVILINRDEEKNLQDAMAVNQLYASCSQYELYCFCSTTESECIIDNMNQRNFTEYLQPMKLRRVLPIRNEVYHYLQTHSPFSSAHSIRGERWINIVILGMNHYGLEMWKALLWFCQMEGYFLRLDVFDVSSDLEDRLGEECPGILERNGIPRIGEDYYDIHFYPDTNYSSRSFYQKLSRLPQTSWVITDTGSDRTNFDLAIKLRRHYSGMQIDQGQLPEHLPESIQTPKIVSVIHDDYLSSLLNNNQLCNFRGQCYQIEAIGQNTSAFSYQSLFDDTLEKQAFEMHIRWFPAQEFEMFEYFRRSSIASLLHLPYRTTLCDSKESAAITEHRRWCAYMRSTEGYTYGIARDDLARRHPSLTAFDNLSQIEKKKDEVMNN